MSRCLGDNRLGWFVALAPLVGVAWHVIDIPAEAAAAAMLPSVGYLVVLCWAARAAHIPLQGPAGTFAVVWAAGIAAPAAALVNGALRTELGGSGWPVAVVVAPVIEESAKAAVLVVLIAVWPTEMRGVRSGVLLGALTGLGFGMVENMEYFLLALIGGGPLELVQAIVIRGILEAPLHPVFAASIGAGIGLARATDGGRSLPALFGLGAAVAQHAVWNGIASPAVHDVLCNGLTPIGACRGDAGVGQLAVIPLVIAAALAPGVVALVVLARTARRAGA